jgi:hypothetical protein
MAKGTMSSDDAIPQADKQAHTEIAERAGQQGEQATVINKKAEKKEQTQKNGQPSR